MTRQDGERAVWRVNDAVMRLRIGGDERAFDLPLSGDLSKTIGSTRECELFLEDPSGCVSRRHARLSREQGAWLVHDLGSTNGIFQDGERRLMVQLAPGIELGIGPFTLIAESERLMLLRAFLHRIIGWDETRIADVDRALRSVREMATLRGALLVCGAGDLTAVARRIHHLAVGDGRPFVAGVGEGIAALAAAEGGTLCVDAEHLPRDFATIADALRRQDANALVVLCAPSRALAIGASTQVDRTSTIELPPLAGRRSELEQLIHAYAADALAVLGAAGTRFREHEMVWLRELQVGSLAEIDELALRLVAVRNWGVTAGAVKLGISHVALSKWLRRRNIPT